MSSDMMVVCKEDNSTFDKEWNESKDIKEKAFFVDECSMGEPWSKFGKWFGERFCKAPTFFEEMAGLKEHHWMKLTDEDVSSVESALGRRKCNKKLNKKKLLDYMKRHVGKYVSTENW